MPALGGAECRIVIMKRPERVSLGSFIDMALEPGQCSGRKCGRLNKLYKKNSYVTSKQRLPIILPNGFFFSLVFLHFLSKLGHIHILFI